MIAFPRRLLSATLISVAAGLLAAPASAQDREPVAVGVYVPLTGAFAPIGQDMKQGIELAAKHVGTVRGRPLKLVIEDDQANASTGLKKAQQLVQQDKAVLLLGGASSAVVLGLAAQADRLGVPIVTTNGQAVQITGEQCNRFVFRSNPNDAMMARANAVLFEERPELLKKKWFVVYHDFVWGKSNKAEFAKIPGVAIAGEAGRPLGTADWSSAIAQIQASDADAVYLALAVGDDMPAVIKQIRSFGLKHFILPPLGMPDSMLQAVGEAGEGLLTGGLFGSWTLAEGDPTLKAVVDDYFAAYRSVPGMQAIQAYSGARLAFAAIDRAASLGADDLIRSLRTTEIVSVLGPTSFRGEDQQGRVGAYIAQAVKLGDNPYGATYGWKVIKQTPWQKIAIDPAQTGCKGL